MPLVTRMRTAVRFGTMAGAWAGEGDAEARQEAIEVAQGSQLISALGEAVHPMGVMQRVTDRTLELMTSAFGVMVGLADETGITYVAGSGNQVDLVGTRVQMSHSLSGLSIRTAQVLRSQDTEDDARVDREACRRHSVRSLVCVPLQRGERAVGVLAVNAPEPDVFSDDDVVTLTQLASFITVAISSAFELHQVSAELVALGLDQDPAAADRAIGPGALAQRYVMDVLAPGGASRLDAHERIEAVLLEPDQLGIALQPIVDVATGSMVAAEALARFATVPVRPPDAWFAEAHRCDLGVALEVLAARRAFALLDDLPPHLSLSVNIGPAAAMSPLFREVLEGAPTDRIILELTEHTVVDDYPQLVAALRSLRRAGVRVAIDDTGAGYSSLAHLLKIAPDLIKLDRELTSGIDVDPVRRAMAMALITFAADTGAQIVAEGVETADELAELERLGVPWAQGFHLGRPMPLIDLLAHLP
jgi:EAL domain-containing protein (putative c-di-GMP-specific phosphodiesterase class I)